MRGSPGVARRTVVVAGLSGVAGVAGCLGSPSGGSEPQERTYDLTITRAGEGLAMSVDPAGDVADVVQVNVGDTVVFRIENATDVPVGFHNHASDDEVVIDAGHEHTMEFEATEGMTGRHGLEGWIAGGTHDEGDGHGGEDGDHHDGGDGHDGEDGDHAEGDDDHDGTDDHDGDAGHSDEGDEGDHGEHEGTELAVLEVRPRGS